MARFAHQRVPRGVPYQSLLKMFVAERLKAEFKS
jgi:hypothetical protein